jgi:hypothetical protein
MKTKEQSFSQRLARVFFRRPARRRDALLVFNMSIFNFFTDGWSRTFSKNEYARFYA